MVYSLKYIAFWGLMIVFGFSYTLIPLLLYHLTVDLLCGLWRNWSALRSIYYPLHKELDNEGPNLGQSPNVSILVRIFHNFHRGPNKMLPCKCFSVALRLSCILPLFTFSSLQLLNPVQLFAIPWTAAHQASLSITNSWSLLKLMSIKSVMPFNHLILCRPLSPPAFNLSQHQGLFKWISFLHQVAKVLEFQLQHQSFQWTPRTDSL